MVVGLTKDTVVLLSMFTIGIGIGIFQRELLIWSFSCDWDSSDGRKEGDEGPYSEEQVSVNVAILYATLAIVLSSVLTQWPPEGQNINSFLEDPLFFLTIFLVSYVAGKVTRLIYRLDMKQYVE